MVNIVLYNVNNTWSRSSFSSVMTFVNQKCLSIDPIISLQTVKNSIKDSQFAILETVMTAITDIWPEGMKYRIRILTGMAIGMFFLGINLCTQSGLYWLDIMDNAAAGWALMLTGLIETIAVAWFYGVPQLIKDIETMIGPRSRLWWAYWVICWSFVTPVLLIGILIWQFVEYVPIEGPGWALTVNWLITATGLVIIVGWMIYSVSLSQFYGNQIRNNF